MPSELRQLVAGLSAWFIPVDKRTRKARLALGTRRSAFLRKSILTHSNTWLRAKNIRLWVIVSRQRYSHLQEEYKISGCYSSQGNNKYNHSLLL